MLALSESLVAAADKRPGDMQAALEHAAELAQHTGEGNAYWMGFGPTNVGLWRMAGALEIGGHERAVAIAEGLRPEVRPNRPRQAAYWLDYRPCAAPGVAPPPVCSPRPPRPLLTHRSARSTPSPPGPQCTPRASST
jgi:hypothetical protein